MSDGNETNHPAAVTIDDAVTNDDAAQQPAEPQIQVLRGNPTDEELAALIGVLSAAGGGAREPGPAGRNLWGNPADKLRYSMVSWQRMTLLERNHMRR